MNRIIISVLIFLISCWEIFCSLEKPTAPDGTMSMKIVVVDTSGVLSLKSPSRRVVVPNAQILMSSTEYDVLLRYETDINGICEVKNVLASRYRISIYKYLSSEIMVNLGNEPVNCLLAGSAEITIDKNRIDNTTDTLTIGSISLSQLVINEIYYSGPANSGTYFSDQFVELYNASDSVLYLDKIFICRINSAAIFNNSLAAIEYYQFPGAGREHPIAPKQLIVIAQDAIDHVKVGGARGSIDLSHADWEFYNKYVPDIDNPEVPNLENIAPDKVAVDFCINLKADEVCLIKIDDADLVRYYQDNGQPTNYRMFNISRVLDGVEYSPNPNHLKTFDIRIDAGLAGYKINWYLGRSIERHHPITGGPGYDTNNSTFDFVTLSHPTPGWQHTESDIISP